MVGPLYRDPRPAAQLLISSAAHQSLVHDHRLVKSRPPYRRNLASRAISRHVERERERRGGCLFRSYLRSYVLYVGLTKVYRETFPRFFSCFCLLNPSPPSPLPLLYDFALVSSILPSFSSYRILLHKIYMCVLVNIFVEYLWRTR